MSSRAKHWVFTINNPTVPIIYDESVMECLSYQLESGTNGTPHFQGAVSFKKKLALSTVKKNIEPAGSRGHYEVMRGRPIQAHDYANKEDSRLLDHQLSGTFRYGDIPTGQGKRTDLHGALEAVREGVPLIDLVNGEHGVAFVKYHKGLERTREILRAARVKPARFKLEDFNREPINLEESPVVILHGNTGLGKTQYALAHFERPYLVSHIDQLRDFDDTRFDGIVFDDMSFSHMPANTRIHLVDDECDRHIHVRYSTAFIPAGTKKIFTTNIGWDIIVSPTDDLAQTQAIRRRVDLVEIVDKLF